ncbi:MAG: MFS transporter [Thaumarchaeota archaeon]|nr:MFS transporter [Nitrososphaerota archaeon]
MAARPSPSVSWIATAAFTPVAFALTADMYESKRGEIMGFFSSATMIGRLIAPILAGAILSLAGFREAYIVCGGVGVIALASILSPSVSEPNRRSGQRDKVVHEVFRILVRGDVVAASIVMAVTYFAMQGLETFLPIYMKNLGIEAWLIGAVFTIQLLVMTLLEPYAGRLSDKVGRIKITAAGLTISALGLIGIKPPERLFHAHTLDRRFRRRSDFHNRVHTSPGLRAGKQGEIRGSDRRHGDDKGRGTSARPNIHGLNPISDRIRDSVDRDLNDACSHLPAHLPEAEELTW